MPEQVYVYSLQGSADELRQKADTHLGTPIWHWVADSVRLEVGGGQPEAWKDQGSVFNERGELRWWRRNGVYEALLVTEEPAEGLEPVPGTWQGETQLLFLQDVRERRVKPNFSTYPGGKTDGRIEARMCYRDGVAVLVSLRKLSQASEASKEE